MASCDDDFSLLGDDDNNHQTNPNHHHHHNRHSQQGHHHHAIHQPYAPRRFNSKSNSIHTPPETKDLGNHHEDGDGGNENDIVVETPSAFNSVSPFSADENSNPYGDAAIGGDPSRSRNIDLRMEKRSDREELSDGGTAGGGGAGMSPYSFKKPRPTSMNEYRKDREEWSDAAIGCLLDAYMDKFTQLNKGSLRGRDWEEVALAVSERCDKQSKSVDQCKNKIDNLKKRYKLERHRMRNDSVYNSHWPWLKKMEEIVGSSLPIKSATDDDGGASSSGNASRQGKRYASTTVNPGLQITNIKSKPISNPRWRRVVFKVSGSALACTGPTNVDAKVIMLIAREVVIACRLGVEVVIVVGSRNFFCGNTWITASGLDRSTAYQISMMASVMNSLLLQSSLEKMGVQARVQTSYAVQEIAEPYNRRRAIRHLEKGRVVIFGGIGATAGNPLFSTDTAAVLQASEINAEAVLKGTNVDGVYDCHSQDSNAIFEHISFRDMASRGVTSMDAMSLKFCEENSIPVVVFNLLEPGNISRALCGEQVGTLIDQTGRLI